MNTILATRTARRIMLHDAMDGMKVSSWPAGRNQMKLSVVAPNDPNGTKARAAFDAAWTALFSSRRCGKTPAVRAGCIPLRTPPSL